VIIPPLFWYFLPFYYPYILLHFKMFSIVHIYKYISLCAVDAAFALHSRNISSSLYSLLL